MKMIAGKRKGLFCNGPSLNSRTKACLIRLYSGTETASTCSNGQLQKATGRVLVIAHGTHLVTHPIIKACPDVLFLISRMTTKTRMVQFSRDNQPDRRTGYTLDDNTRALVAFCMHYLEKPDEELLLGISKYFRFIRFCQQDKGDFQQEMASTRCASRPFRRKTDCIRSFTTPVRRVL